MELLSVGVPSGAGGADGAPALGGVAGAPAAGAEGAVVVSLLSACVG